MPSPARTRDHGATLQRADLTGRERHLRGAMQAMSRIAARFSRGAGRALPFLVRRRSRLLPQSVAIVSGIGGTRPPRSGVRLEVTLEGKDGAGWGELVIDAEGLATILEGTLGASGSGGARALGNEMTPAAKALATRIARALSEPFIAAVRDEVGLVFSIAGVRAISPDDPSEPRSSDGLRVDCLFEGEPTGGTIALAMSAEALESAARDHDETPPQQGDPMVAEALHEVSLELVAELGTATLGLRRLLSLRVGDVIRLPTAIDDAIPVRIAGVRKLDAVPVTSRGQIAIEVRGRHED